MLGRFVRLLLDLNRVEVTEVRRPVQAARFTYYRSSDA
jgi:hypothetical protein